MIKVTYHGTCTLEACNVPYFIDYIINNGAYDISCTDEEANPIINKEEQQ